MGSTFKEPAEPQVLPDNDEEKEKWKQKLFTRHMHSERQGHQQNEFDISVIPSICVVYFRTIAYGSAAAGPDT